MSKFKYNVQVLLPTGDWAIIKNRMTAKAASRLRKRQEKAGETARIRMDCIQ